MTTNAIYIFVTKLGRLHILCNCTAFNTFHVYNLRHSGSDAGGQGVGISCYRWEIRYY